VSDPWTDLEQALAGDDPAQVHRTTDRVRDTVRGAFEGRQLVRGSLLVERRRRLEHTLAELDDAVAGDRIDEASERAERVRELAPVLVDQARQLDPIDAEEEVSAGGWLANAGTVARKEAVLGIQGTRGLLLFGILGLTFGIGLRSAIGGSTATGGQASVKLVWNYAHSLAFLALPLAGLLAGHGLVNEERRSDTIHVLAAQPVGRTGIVLGKWLGMAATLGLAVAASAGLVGTAAYAVTGTLGPPSAAVTYPLACFGLALAFGSIALLASTLLERTGPTLAVGLASFVLLGPVWQNAFLTRSLEQAGTIPDPGSVLVYLATPFTAWWNWTSELLGPVNEATGLPQGEPWHAALVNAVETGALEALPFYATQPYYAIVIAAWIAVCLGLAAAVFRRQDLA
jgi:Cu-processing system permease protein